MPGKLATLLLALAAVVAFSCGDDSAHDIDPVQRSDGLEAEPTGHVVAGGAGPIYQEFVRLTPGEYRSPATATQGLREEGLRALEENQAKPGFEGTVNGIRLYLYWNDDPDVCDGGMYARYEEVANLSFDYLPPGTFATTPQSAAICENGSTAGFGQMFKTATTGFDIWYWDGLKDFGHDASEDLISPGSVNGQNAVFIHPVNELGFGRSHVAWLTDAGIIVLDAFMMPFDEVLRIAEGVKCANC